MLDKTDVDLIVKEHLWEFIGHGSYNRAYRSIESFEIDGHTSVWVFKKPFQRASKEATRYLNTAERAVRKWRLVNPNRPIHEGTQAILIPYLGDAPANDRQIAEKLIEIYQRTGLIIMDPYAKNNFLVHQGEVVCIDVDLAYRRGSFNSEQFIALFVEDDRFKHHPITKTVLSILIYLDEHLRNYATSEHKKITCSILPVLNQFRLACAPISPAVLDQLLLMFEWPHIKQMGFTTPSDVASLDFLVGQHMPYLLFSPKFVEDLSVILPRVSESWFIDRTLEALEGLLSSGVDNPEVIHAVLYCYEWMNVNDSSLELYTDISEQKRSLLYQAVVKNCQKNLLYLLSIGATYPENSRLFPSLIHVAVNHRSCHLVKQLVGHFPNSIEEKDQHGRTPLLFAAYLGDVQLMKWFVEHGADFCVTDSDGHSVMDLAIQSEEYDSAVWCYQYRMKANHVHDHFCNRSVIMLLKDDLLDGLRCLIEQNKSLLIEKDSFGRGLFEIAIANQAEVIALYLLDQGIEIPTPKPNNPHVILIAASHRLSRVVRALLSRHPNLIHVMDMSYKTLLWRTAEQGDNGLIQTLISMGANLNTAVRNEIDGQYHGFSPLDIAIWNGHVSTVKSLLQAGARSHQRHRRFGETMSQLIRQDACEKVQFLIDQCPDLLDEIDASGFKPIELAAEFEADETVMYLLSVYSTHQNHPIHQSVIANRQTIVMCLISYSSVLLKQTNESGDNVLDLALEYGHVDMAKKLLSIGAVPEKKHWHIGFKTVERLIHDDNFSGFVLLCRVNISLFNYVNAQELTLLEILMMANREKWVEFVLKNRPDLFIKLDDGARKRVLAWAINRVNSMIVNQCFAYGVQDLPTDYESDSRIFYCWIEIGQLKVIDCLIRHDRGLLCAPGEEETTPLDAAIQYSHEEIACYFLQNNPVAVNEVFLRPNLIHAASASNLLDVVRALLTIHPGLIAHVDSFERTPLLWAIENNHEEMVQLLIDLGAEIRFESIILFPHSALPQRCEYSILDWLAVKGHYNLFRLFYQKGIRLKQKHRVFGNESLIDLIKKNQLDIVKALLEEYPEAMDAATLIAAVDGGHVDMINDLLSLSAPVLRPIDGHSHLIHQAAQKGFLNVVSYCLAQFPECAHFKDEYSRTPLMFAAANGHIPVISVLIHHGVDVTSVVKVDCVDDPNYPSIQGNSALDFAFLSKYYAAADLLLMAGSTFSHTYRLMDATVLSQLIIEGQFNLICAFVSAYPWVVVSANDDRFQFVRFAIELGNEPIADYLLTQGFVVSDLKPFHQHEIHIAIQNRMFVLAEKLMMQNVDVVNLQNHEGKTPLDLAIEVGALQLSRRLVLLGGLMTQDHKRFGGLSLRALYAQHKFVEMDWLCQQRKRYRGSFIQASRVSGTLMFHRRPLSTASSTFSEVSSSLENLSSQPFSK